MSLDKSKFSKKLNERLAISERKGWILKEMTGEEWDDQPTEHWGIILNYIFTAKATGEKTHHCQIICYDTFVKKGGTAIFTAEETEAVVGHLLNEADEFSALHNIS